MKNLESVMVVSSGFAPSIIMVEEFSQSVISFCIYVYTSSPPRHLSNPLERPTSIPCSHTHWVFSRSEEHTSELQSRGHLVCRLLLEKKKTNKNNPTMIT